MDTRVTKLLGEVESGRSEAVPTLAAALYGDLRVAADRLMRREPCGQTLQVTELIHEAYLRLVDQNRVDWKGRTHFVAVAAEVMRRILVDEARRRGTQKRGEGWNRVPLDGKLHPSTPAKDEVDLIGLDEALTQLAVEFPRPARVVELRFFGGMSVEEVHVVLGVSDRTVKKDWKFAKAWLAERLASRP
jgi:RNA polymerase sigma factor (TIGR02999 family)